MSNTKKIILHIISAAGISICLIWGIGAISLSSPRVVVNENGMAVSMPGTFLQHRTENWATTYYGELGLEVHDSAKLKMNTQKILFLGDSHVEAHMMPIAERMQNQDFGSDYSAIAIGHSGANAVDFNAWMKFYNQAINNVAFNVVVITDINDMLPSPTEPEKLFSEQRPRKIRFPNSDIRLVIMKLRLNFLYALTRKLSTLKLDFIGNHWLKVQSNVLPTQTVDYRNYWTNMLATMKVSSANAKLILLYLPDIPKIQAGKISNNDPSEKIAKLFAKICMENDVVFINCGADMSRLYTAYQIFPRGFDAGRIGAGHINKWGHLLIATKLKEYICRSSR